LRAFFFRDFFAIVASVVVAAILRSSKRHPRTEVTRRGWIPEHARDVSAGGTTMADEIRAEMVANVWKVVKAEGDEVIEGDTLVILESMKMEIPVIAESDGTLVRLAVHEGDVVQEGDLIAEVG
jgi:acetyl-CoA carboxylase biotin carboxyl carrier protein